MLGFGKPWLEPVHQGKTLDKTVKKTSHGCPVFVCRVLETTFENSNIKDIFTTSSITLGTNEVVYTRTLITIPRTRVKDRFRLVYEESQAKKLTNCGWRCKFVKGIVLGDYLFPLA